MVDIIDLEVALEFASNNFDPDSHAVINRKTGEICYHSIYVDTNEIPDDFNYDDENYLTVPSKRELDLGERLVFEFVEEFIPEKYDEVRHYFRSRGAYGRYKSLLEALKLLDKWHKFEDRRTREALIQWGKENGLEVNVGNKTVS